MRATMHVWRSEDNTQGAALSSFHHVGGSWGLLTLGDS